MEENQAARELRELREKVARLEREKKERELDEPIGTIAGVCTIALLATFGGILWLIGQFTGFSLLDFLEQYTFIGIPSLLLVTGIAFLIAMAISLSLTNAIFRSSADDTPTEVR